MRRAVISLVGVLGLYTGCDSEAVVASPAPEARTDSKAVCTPPPVDEEFPNDPSNANFPKGWVVFTQVPGTTDDTHALQQALDALDPPGCGAPPCRNTLFLPRGDYNISGTLYMATRGIRIIGADPSSTRIHWRGQPYVNATEISLGNVGVFHGPDRDSLWGFDSTSYPDVVESLALPYPQPTRPKSWMFLLNGAGGGELKRLTLDGAGRAEAAIRIANNRGLRPNSSWVDASGRLHGSNASGFRFTDLIIADSARGIWAGYFDPVLGNSANDDEGYILRTRFLRIGKAHSVDVGLPPGAAQAGVLLSAQQTYNWDIQDSSFEDCDAGIVAAVGGFNAWHNVFTGSRVSDLYFGGSGGRFEARDNTSQGSWRFVLTDGSDENGHFVPLVNPQSQSNQGAGWYKPIILANNAVLAPRWAALDLRTQAALIIDNTLQSATFPDGSVHAPIQFTIGPGYQSAGTYSPNNLTIIGNAFSGADTTAASLVSNTWWRGSLQAGQWSGPPPMHLVQFGNATWLGPPAVPAPPVAPTYHGRPVVEITPSMSVAAINHALIDAMALPTRPMFHFQSGVYYLDSTIVVPAGFDGILAGDGVGTQLLPDFQSYAGVPGTTYLDLPPGSTFPLFKLLAPARATVRDLLIQTAGSASAGTADPARPQVRAFVINSFDSFGDQTYLRQTIVSASNADKALSNGVLTDTFSRGLMVDGLDANLVRSDKGAFGAANIGVLARGSPTAPPSQAGVRLNGGSAGLTWRSVLRTERNAILVEQGVEHESVLGYDLSNDGGPDGASGRVTLAGSSNLIVPTHPLPLTLQYGDLNATGFQGKLTVLAKNSDMHVVRGGTPHADDGTLLLGYLFENHTPIAPWAQGQAPVYDPIALPNQPMDCGPVQSIASAFLAKQNRAYASVNGDFGYKDCAELNTISGGVSAETSFMSLLLRDFRASRVLPWTRTCQTDLADLVIDRVDVSFFDPVGNIQTGKVLSYGGAIHLRKVTAAGNR